MSRVLLPVLLLSLAQVATAGDWSEEDLGRLMQAVDRASSAAAGGSAEAATWLLALGRDLRLVASPLRRERRRVAREIEDDLDRRDEMLRYRHHRHFTDDETVEYKRLVRRLERQMDQLEPLEVAVVWRDLLLRRAAIGLSGARGAAREVVRSGIAHDRAPGVRRVALYALRQGGRGGDVPALLTLLGDREDGAGPPPDPGNSEARRGDPQRAPVDAPLPLIAGPSDDPRFLALALRALGRCGSAEDVYDAGVRKPVARCVGVTAARLGDHRWRVRAAAAEALGALGHPDGIRPLVARLPAEEGRMAEDIEAALHSITGVWQSGAQTWARWLAQHEKDLWAAVTRAKAAERRGGSVGAVRFYGIHTRSRLLAFVVDTSGSMKRRVSADPNIRGADKHYPKRGSKWSFASYELRRAIKHLPDQGQFALVHFNTFVRLAQPTGDALVTADKRDKRTASNWIRNRLEPLGGTNLLGALRRGLALSAGGGALDTLFVLTDGAPTVGGAQQSDEVRAWVDWANAPVLARIHAVGVGPAAELDFLRGLAEEQTGRWIHVATERGRSR